MRVFLFAALVATAYAQENATFSKFFIIVFENHGYDQVVGHSGWKKIIDTGMLLTNYKGVAHPSQPNYVATLGADTLGCSSDSDFSTSKEGLVDTLNAKGVTWKTYQENYNPKSGGDCNMESSNGKYYRKHNPFMSFKAITSNKTACQSIVPEGQLEKDISSGNLAQFMYYTPNIDNDSHNKPLDFSASYMEGWLSKYKKGLLDANTLILATWDEDEHKEGNHVVAVLWGNGIAAGSKDKGTAYTHYSIAKTCQDWWGVKSLGRGDVKAHSILGAVQEQQPNVWEDVEEIDTAPSAEQWAL